MAVASGKDLLDIEMQIGKRGHIELKELARTFVPRERRREGIRFPCGLRVQPFEESVRRGVCTTRLSPITSSQAPE
jgi:hypothetical protein